jgi:hypothetical protein
MPGFFYVDPDRAHYENATGIHVRAKSGEQWVSVDIACLDKRSLWAFLRARGGNNQWAEDVVAIMLGHGQFSDETVDEIVEHDEPGTVIDISSLDKADVFMRLYNAATIPPAHTPAGILARATPGPMTLAEAQRCVEDKLVWDYCNGRPLKIDLSTNTLDVRLYDHAHGMCATAAFLAPALERAKALGRDGDHGK